jgi:hypothetical protein
MFLSTQRDTTAGPSSTNTTAPVSACYWVRDNLTKQH